MPPSRMGNEAMRYWGGAQIHGVINGIGSLRNMVVARGHNVIRESQGPLHGPAKSQTRRICRVSK